MVCVDDLGCCSARNRRCIEPEAFGHMVAEDQASLGVAGQRQWRDYVAQQCDSRAANNFMRVPTALTPGEDSSVRVRVR